VAGGPLEDRGPQFTLLGAIDDATGIVPSAHFRDREDSQGYFLLLEQVVRAQGIPVALYHDRHGIFLRSKGAHPERLTIAEQLTGAPARTQFGRLLDELGIGSIAARSPQAKGRIERLWGTFQDRLVSELRLAGARTMDEANAVLAAFLPRYNARFAVPPAVAGSAYRPVPAGLRREQLFCFKYERTVAADNTVPLGPHRIQLLADRHRASYARTRVEIQVRMDGAIAVSHEGRLVGSAPAPAEAPLLRIQGARITYRLPGQAAPPLLTPLGPLPWDVVAKRLHPHSLEDDIIQAPGFPARPGPNHPWRKMMSAASDQALRLRSGRESQPEHQTTNTADRFTDRFDGQNH
jgi:hypothetical protein